MSTISGLTATISFVSVFGNTRFELGFALLALSISSAIVALIVGIGGTLRNVGFIARFGCAFIVGFLGLIPIEKAADSMNLAILGSWAMAHGSYFVVVPTIGAAVYFALGWVPGLRES
jgi:hypothetical protein